MLELDFSRFPVLETDRLQLRRLSLHDTPEIFMLRSDAEHNRYVDRPKATSFNDARQFIEKIDQLIDSDQALMWAITYKNSALLMGTIGFWNIDTKNAAAEVGYELLPLFQGQGIMHEAFQKTLEYVFNKLHLKAIAAYTVPANKNSVSLLQKAGFKQTGATGEEDIYTLKVTDFK